MKSKNKKRTIILGIDPGTATTGFGVIYKEGGEIGFIDCGIIKTSPKTSFPKRLLEIEKDLSSIIKKHKPNSVAIEKIFFAKNTKTAIEVGHARGVAILVAAKSKKDIFEYTPLEVKQAITGYGGADKKQIQEMVKCTLCLEQIPKPDDAADALAIAICHSQNRKL